MSEHGSAISLEQLIRDLNDPRNQAAPETIHVIQRRIQNLQRQKSAWQIGLDLLEHHESQIRFYGALTLTIKINVDWENDEVGRDRNLFNELLTRIVSSYIRLAAIPDASYVLQKLCTTLVAIFQKADAAWALPVRHVFACTVAGRYVQQSDAVRISEILQMNGNISGNQLRAVLLLATTLAEEMSETTGAGKPHQVSVKMSNNAQDVWDLLGYCSAFISRAASGDQNKAFDYLLQVGADEAHTLELAKSTIQLLPHWTGYVKVKGGAPTTNGSTSMDDHLRSALRTYLSLFAHSVLADTILQTFTILETSSHKLLHKVMPGYSEVIIRSEQAASWLKSLIEGDFEPDAQAYAEYLEALMSNVDVTAPDYLKDDQCVEALQQVYRLLGCDGAAGVDNAVSPIALEIFSSIVEGYGDWDGPSTYKDGMRILVAQACSACLRKLVMPTEELSPATQCWDADDRAKFQDFRYDVQDFLQDAFGIVGISLIEDIVASIVNLDAGWGEFEGNMFALIAFSDNMAAGADTYDQYLDTIFRSKRWCSAIDATSGAPERVRQIMIRFLGENTGYLQRRAESLVSSLNFLFESLHIETSVTAASKAIWTLCDNQRSALTEALPQFMQSLRTISGLEADAKSRIYGGVSSIVQALPDEQSKLKPLQSILEAVQLDVTALFYSDCEAHEFRAKATDILFTLAAIGKGSRGPSDTVEDSEEPVSREPDFWTNGLGSNVQQSALYIYRLLHEKANADNDSLFVEATCDFLRSAFTENHPSPFKFTSTTVLEVLSRHVHLSTPQPDVVLGTASSYLASVSTSNPEQEYVPLLTRVLQECAAALDASRTQQSIAFPEFCAASLEFLGRMLPKWATFWLTMSNVGETTPLIIELGLSLLRDADTMTRRAAATFFSALFEASANAKVLADPQAAANMKDIMETFGPHVLGAIVRLLGGECARSELESLTEPLKRFVLRQPLLANKLIREAVKEENGVLTPQALHATKPEQRARFAAQVEMLRGARKTNEIVRGFWIDCKGSSFGYVT